MSLYEAPAKLNLSLLVSPPGRDGLHPNDSLVQTIEWCDLLEISEGEGEEVIESDFEPDLVERALAVAREFGSVPPLSIRLEKEIPIEAGLGGGSSDAAAVLLACAEFGDLERAVLVAPASRIGADVALFLTGGTVIAGGFGERISPTPPADGFAVAVVVPPFGLATKEVYARWDEMEGPTGDTVADHLLPPSIRGRMPMRNDLLPAALSLEPRLGDFMSEVSSIWGTPACLTGSGSACFGYFATVGEAADAALSTTHLAASARGVQLRPRGVHKRTRPGQ